MNSDYDANYWDEYYGGKYESTFLYGFNFHAILTTWKKEISETELPNSFLDIGCGPGHTLVEVEKKLPNAFVYGIEIQKIPKERVVHKNVMFGDFLEVHEKLTPADLVYCACAMYIDFDQMEQFLTGSVDLALKAIVFANLYMEDGTGIPSDKLRRSIFNNRAKFKEYITKTFGLRKVGQKSLDFYIKTV
jgi:trans-aconitate methyltransferase